MNKISAVLSSVVMLSVCQPAFSQISATEYCSVSAVALSAKTKPHIADATQVPSSVDIRKSQHMPGITTPTSTGELMKKGWAASLTAIEFIIAGAANYMYSITASDGISLYGDSDQPVVSSNTGRTSSLSGVINQLGSERLSMWATPVSGGLEAANSLKTVVPVTVNYN